MFKFLLKGKGRKIFKPDKPDFRKRLLYCMNIIIKGFPGRIHRSTGDRDALLLKKQKILN